MKKILSIFIVTAMLLSVCPVSAKSVFSDVPEGHWAEKQIDAWSNYGIINGYEGRFSPDNKITRGDFAVVLNKLMAYEKTTENRFADLGEKYYTESILKLNKAGVMQGYDGKISPEDSLTREEAAIMICRALGIETQEKANKTFSDYASVSDWARPYINAMVNESLLNGSDGKLNPKNTITRAEVVTILDNAVHPILKAGEYSDIETNKILVVSAGDVVIKNSKFDGKIIVTQGVNDGEITFTDSTIDGAFLVDNAREEFVVLENTTVNDDNILDEAIVVKKTEEKDDKDDNKEDEKDEPTGGGGGGGGGGGNKPKPNYGEINAEMVENLQLISDDIAMYIDPSISDFYSVFTDEERYILRKIKTCIDDVIKQKDKVKIDADYIKNEYNSEISEVKDIYDEMQAEGRANGFHSRLFVNLNSYTLFWLAETLGIDLSEYGINPGDYI